MRTFLILASVLLFLLSLALPVVTFKDTRPQENNSETWYGWGVLFLGWFGPRVDNYAWFANLFWLVGSLFLIRPGKVSLVLLSIAMLLALNTFTLPGKVAAWNSEGMRKEASALHYGAYVWLLAMACQFGAAVVSLYKR
ncbi:hypothetical protein F183_A09510 [Bryobacterales bacterium F-183]|nr:hypothetical protein F183_A09510 [Bryobacterales bacterium F-183]